MMCLEGRSYRVTACDSRVAAVHMVRPSRTGCPDHIVKSHRGPEHCYRSNILTLAVAEAYAVPQQILFVLRMYTKLVGLGRSNRHYRCSSLHSVTVAAWVNAGHSQIHAGPVPGTMLVELGLNSHRYWSFVRWMSTRSCCSDSAISISM